MPLDLALATVFSPISVSVTAVSVFCPASSRLATVLHGAIARPRVAPHSALHAAAGAGGVPGGAEARR
jgi:hypothetical protein